ncbi:MAG: DHHA1 domain-containing protein, partial [Oscillospiraceae bacterium]
KIPVCCAVIDPHQEDCQSPIGAKNLCGAGVALKLILAIEGEEDYLESFCFEYYCQIAAIGTIADIVSLKDENRFIVQKGIEFIKNSDVSGLIALFNNAGVDIKKVNSSNIAFGIVPRINATGRMNSAKMALNLLLCENEEEVLFYVNEISSQNNKRKETEQFIIEEIEKDIKENPEKLNGRIGIFYNQGWNHGVIGIVCARLMEKLQKPIILISIENGEARGSARSFEGFNIYDALNSCADIFTKFGGHDMAAGFSLPPEKIDEFIYAIEQYSKNNYKNMPFLTLNVDMQISPEFLTIDNIESLNILEPFGKDNTLPIFLMKDVIIVDIVSLTNGKYVKLKILKDNKALEFMVFNKTFLSFEYIKGDIIDIAFDVSINIYNDKKSITLKVVDIIPSKFNFTLFEVGKNIYDSFKRNEEISSSNAEKILPTQEDMLNVYKYIKQNPNLCKTEEILYSRMLPYKINYCKMLIIIDVLYQLNLIGKNETGIYSLPYKEKVDFKTTEIYKKIEKYIKK